MKLGISTASYFLRCYTEEALVPIAKLGAECAEVFYATFSEYTEEFAKQINKELKKANEINPLYIHSVHALTTQFEPELYNLNSRAFNDAIKIYRDVCRAAQLIGAKYYTFHGATIQKRAVKYVFDYNHIASRVNMLCEVAEEYGVRLCYENVHWAYFHKPEFFEILGPMCPKVGTVLDIKQAMQSKYDYKDYLKVMGKSLQTVHLCDYNSDGSLEIPGRGSFDFVEFFKYLLDFGYEGPCLMEVYSKNYRTEQELGESFEYLKSCLDKAMK